MLIGIYTDKNGNRWETYKSDNPSDVLGPFYQRKFRGADDEVGTLAVRGMRSPALEELAERFRLTGEIYVTTEENITAGKAGTFVKSPEKSPSEPSMRSPAWYRAIEPHDWPHGTLVPSDRPVAFVKTADGIAVGCVDTPTLSQALADDKGNVIAAVGPLDELTRGGITGTLIGVSLPAGREWGIVVMRRHDTVPFIYRGFASRSAARSALDAATPATSSVNVIKQSVDKQ